jgi:hypothetical protein
MEGDAVSGEDSNGDEQVSTRSLNKHLNWLRVEASSVAADAPAVLKRFGLCGKLRSLQLCYQLPIFAQVLA